jgi:hypothetical protein
LLNEGVELILVAGGMSVDPDDITRMAIAEARAEDVVTGTPVLPGAMFLVGRFGRVPVLGLPAGVLYYRATGPLSQLRPLPVSEVSVQKVMLDTG